LLDWSVLGSLRNNENVKTAYQSFLALASGGIWSVPCLSAGNCFKPKVDLFSQIFKLAWPWVFLVALICHGLPGVEEQFHAEFISSDCLYVGMMMRQRR
jgi:hypothetical protein